MSNIYMFDICHCVLCTISCCIGTRYNATLIRSIESHFVWHSTMSCTRICRWPQFKDTLHSISHIPTTFPAVYSNYMLVLVLSLQMSLPCWACRSTRNMCIEWSQTHAAVIRASLVGASGMETWLTQRKHHWVKISEKPYTYPWRTSVHQL